MPIIRCIICNCGVGKRVCLNENNQLICSPGCTKRRSNNQCGHCIYFQITENWQKEKTRNQLINKKFLFSFTEKAQNYCELGFELFEKEKFKEAEEYFKIAIEDSLISLMPVWEWVFVKPKKEIILRPIFC